MRLKWTTIKYLFKLYLVKLSEPSSKFYEEDIDFWKNTTWGGNDKNLRKSFAWVGVLSNKHFRVAWILQIWNYTPIMVLQKIQQQFFREIKH